ncbi:MAG: hypothetical protein ACON5A_02240 [Candidatus Comchoanobacterales bacterium]
MKNSALQQNILLWLDDISIKIRLSDQVDQTLLSQQKVLKNIHDKINVSSGYGVNLRQFWLSLLLEEDIKCPFADVTLHQWIQSELQSITKHKAYEALSMWYKRYQIYKECQEKLDDSDFKWRDKLASCSQKEQFQSLVQNQHTTLREAMMEWIEHSPSNQSQQLNQLLEQKNKIKDEGRIKQMETAIQIEKDRLNQDNSSEDLLLKICFDDWNQAREVIKSLDQYKKMKKIKRVKNIFARLKKNNQKGNYVTGLQMADQLIDRIFYRIVYSNEPLPQDPMLVTLSGELVSLGYFLMNIDFYFQTPSRLSLTLYDIENLFEGINSIEDHRIIFKFPDINQLYQEKKWRQLRSALLHADDLVYQFNPNNEQIFQLEPFSDESWQHYMEISEPQKNTSIDIQGHINARKNELFSNHKLFMFDNLNEHCENIARILCHSSEGLSDEDKRLLSQYGLMNNNTPVEDFNAFLKSHYLVTQLCKMQEQLERKVSLTSSDVMNYFYEKMQIKPQSFNKDMLIVKHLHYGLTQPEYGLIRQSSYWDAMSSLYQKVLEQGDDVRFDLSLPRVMNAKDTYNLGCVDQDILALFHQLSLSVTTKEEYVSYQACIHALCQYRCQPSCDHSVTLVTAVATFFDKTSSQLGVFQFIIPLISLNIHWSFLALYCVLRVATQIYLEQELTLFYDPIYGLKKHIWFHELKQALPDLDDDIMNSFKLIP